MSRYLVILEVSQKQAYIFASKKLQDNIENSDQIARITSSSFIVEAVNDKAIFNEEDNLVYSGGGHIILEYENHNTAQTMVRLVTTKVFEDYPGLELFAAIQVYDEDKAPGDNVKELTKALENKKSLRRASFRQGTFGIEKLNSETGNPELTKIEDSFKEERDSFVPEGFSVATQFEYLGGSKGESNFIAVVHVDGNGMGKRVEKFASQYSSWEDYKKNMRLLSEGIAEDFKDALKNMNHEIAEFYKTEKGFEALALTQDETNRTSYFPVRRVITEGDDICFVTEGRIGIECARIFIEQLTAENVKNTGDGQGYSACAGVAIVHQKYPFYRAYELAESLCSNAKKFGATLSPEDNGASVSSIDWHIEFGELKDSLEDTRKQYETRDEKYMNLRPYIVKAGDNINTKEPIRQYKNFRKLMQRIDRKHEFYASGALKELRPVLKRGEKATYYYLKYHNMKEISVDAYQEIYKPLDYALTEVGSGKSLEGKIFMKTADGKDRSTVFDAIEAMDTFVIIGEE